MLNYYLIKATIQSMDAQPSRLQIPVEILKISWMSKLRAALLGAPAAPPTPQKKEKERKRKKNYIYM